MNDTIKRHGLVYTEDLKCIIGIDSSSGEFTGAVPNGAERIEEEAFSCCSLKSISLPDSVSSVGANLFCNSTELESVRLPRNLRTLSPYMFCGCKSLRQIEMPYEVDDFSEGLFAECTSLEEIPFRAGIKTLPEGVFDCCTSLHTLVIPDSVTKICSGAIAGCSSLTTIVLPASLEEFAPDAISDCPSLNRIRISEQNARFRTDDDSGKLYKKDAAGNEQLIFEVPARIESTVPKVDDSGVPENPSILTFEDDDDAADSAADTPAQGEEDVSARLAEIMGQEKQYDDGDFSIMDIPAASDEEIAACCLKSSGSPEKQESDTPDMADSAPADATAFPEPLQESDGSFAAQRMPDENTAAAANDSPSGDEPEAEMPAESAQTMQEQVEDIIKDNAMQPSDDNNDIQIPSEDEPSDAPVATLQGVGRKTNEKSAMSSLVFESEKVKQQVVSAESSAEKILFVFAENLSGTGIEKDFSPRLIKCGNRLAEIHKYTSIFYFYHVNIDNADFREELKSFMQDKDCVVACAESTRSALSERTVELATCVGIKLEKAELLRQKENANNPDAAGLKLILQDILQ